MPYLIVIGIALYAAVFVTLGAYIADQKRRDVYEGALLGLLLGVFGLLIEALLPAQ